jgi:hypothetical protein
MQLKTKPRPAEVRASLTQVFCIGNTGGRGFTYRPFCDTLRKETERQFAEETL